MGKFDITELDVCTDCILLLSNGQCAGCESCVFSDDPESAPCQTVADRMVARWGDDTRHISPGDSPEREEALSGGWFTFPCDGCGSDMHGERHAAVMLIPK